MDDTPKIPTVGFYLLLATALVFDTLEALFSALGTFFFPLLLLAIAANFILTITAITVFYIWLRHYKIDLSSGRKLWRWVLAIVVEVAPISTWWFGWTSFILFLKAEQTLKAIMKPHEKQ